MCSSACLLSFKMFLREQQRRLRLNAVTGIKKRNVPIKVKMIEMRMLHNTHIETPLEINFVWMCIQPHSYSILGFMDKFLKEFFEWDVFDT